MRSDYLFNCGIGDGREESFAYQEPEDYGDGITEFDIGYGYYFENRGNAFYFRKWILPNYSYEKHIYEYFPHYLVISC